MTISLAFYLYTTRFSVRDYILEFTFSLISVAIVSDFLLIFYIPFNYRKLIAFGNYITLEDLYKVDFGPDIISIGY